MPEVRNVKLNDKQEESSGPSTPPIDQLMDSAAVARKLWVRTTDTLASTDSMGDSETESDVQSVLGAQKDEVDLEPVNHTDGDEECATNLASCLPEEADCTEREATRSNAAKDEAESSSSVGVDSVMPPESATTPPAGIHKKDSARCWRFTSARVTGSSHLQNADGCQDWFSLERRGRCFVACLSDGAGSAAHGLLGAQIVCNRFAQGVAKVMNELSADNCVETCETIVAAIHTHLVKLADCLSCGLSELNSTLVAAIVMETFCCTVQLGDSFCVIREATSKEYTLAAGPQKGEFANETYFVAGKHYREKLLVQVRDVPVFIALSSDGLDSMAILIEKQRPFDRFFCRLEAGLKANKITDDNLKEWLRSDELDNRTTDDRSLLLACLGD